MARDFLSNRRGNIAIMFVLFTFPILAGIGMSIEIANINNQRTKLQNAVDAAVLFAGRMFEEKDQRVKKAMVKRFIDANFDNAYNIEKFKLVGTEISLEVSTKVPDFFFGDVYPDAFDQTVTSSVRVPSKHFIELVMVLDNTGSMRGPKMAQLKEVAKDFVDQLETFKNERREIKIGLVPFSQHVNIGMDKEFEYWFDKQDPSWNGCVGSLPAPYTMQDIVPVEMVGGSPVTIRFPGKFLDVCPAPVVPLTNSATELKTAIDAMVAFRATYIGEGVMWGIRLLSDIEPFTEAEPFGSRPSHVNHRKILVVLTDGATNTAPNLPAGPWHTRVHRNDSDPAAGVISSDNTLTACDLARTNEYEVFTIGFGVDVDSDTEILMTDCAGGVENFYDADNHQELKQSFGSILDRILKIHLSS